MKNRNILILLFVILVAGLVWYFGFNNKAEKTENISLKNQIVNNDENTKIDEDKIVEEIKETPDEVVKETDDLEVEEEKIDKMIDDLEELDF